MSELAQQRLAFIEYLHDMFLIHKGYGAYAYISPNQAIKLFEQLQNAGEEKERLVKDFVRMF